MIERQVKKQMRSYRSFCSFPGWDQNRIHVDLEYVDLRDIVEEVCENEKLNDDKNIRLRLSLEKAEAKVDIGLIMTAVRNLVNNAIKYSEKGRNG